MIATRSTGTDHIDLEYCQKKGIEIKNVPDYGSSTVAEHTFALLLAISRKVFYSYQKVQEDNSFSRRGMQDLRGFDLAGKTMGVVGTGKIGKNVIKIAEGFQMKVVAYDAYPDKTIENDNCKCVEVDELLEQADIISLHIPALPETHHFIDEEKMNKMKPGVVLLNTARGSLVDNKALLKFLEEGKIKAAGLDVLEYEDCLGRETMNPDPCVEEAKDINKKFIEMPNVIITPHNAFNTKEALERIWTQTIESIKAEE
jgi:D-lactate dehydrogenase